MRIAVVGEAIADGNARPVYTVASPAAAWSVGLSVALNLRAKCETLTSTTQTRKGANGLQELVALPAATYPRKGFQWLERQPCVRCYRVVPAWRKFRFDSGPLDLFARIGQGEAP